MIFKPNFQLCKIYYKHPGADTTRILSCLWTPGIKSTDTNVGHRAQIAVSNGHHHNQTFPSRTPTTWLKEFMLYAQLVSLPVLGYTIGYHGAVTHFYPTDHRLDYIKYKLVASSFRYNKPSFSPDDMHERMYLIHLDRPITKIPTEHHFRLYNGIENTLYDFGLVGPTPLSAHSPTGRPFSTIHCQSNGHRILYKNLTMMDC